MISAKVVGDSKNEFGNRITTMIVTMPRMLLAEFNTHRDFSRNSSSSRAIPFEKMVKSVQENPFIPIAWQKDHKGMQGTEYLDKEQTIRAIQAWNAAKDSNIFIATNLFRQAGATKQLCNRLLEPFMWHTVIVTATEWENFFALRSPQYGSDEQGYYRSKKDALKGLQSKGADISNLVKSTDLEWLKVNKGQAEIHMMALAECMWDAYNESAPKELKAGEWHIPFEDKITTFEGEQEDETVVVGSNSTSRVKIATVMGARTSYTVVGNDLKPLSFNRMIEIHDEMLKASPKHMSPFEHCAKTMSKQEYHDNIRGYINWAIDGIDDVLENAHGWCGNFRGFIQYRKMIPGENITI